MVNPYGAAGRLGSLNGASTSEPVLGIAPTPDAAGYWLAASNGRVFAFGDAKLFGSLAGRQLAKPIVAISSTPDGGGYWLSAAHGGVFGVGDAGISSDTLPSTSGHPLSLWRPRRAAAGTG